MLFIQGVKRANAHLQVGKLEIEGRALLFSQSTDYANADDAVNRLDSLSISGAV